MSGRGLIPEALTPEAQWNQHILSHKQLLEGERQGMRRQKREVEPFQGKVCLP